MGTVMTTPAPSVPGTCSQSAGKGLREVALPGELADTGRRGLALHKMLFAVAFLGHREGCLSEYEVSVIGSGWRTVLTFRARLLAMVALLLLSQCFGDASLFAFRVPLLVEVVDMLEWVAVVPLVRPTLPSYGKTVKALGRPLGVAIVLLGRKDCG